MMDRLVRGAFGDIARLYAFPAAVYFGKHLIVLKGRQDLIRALSAYRSILITAGLSLIGTEVIGKPMTERDRFTVSVANTYFAVDGSEIGKSQVRYFVQREGGAPKIRLVEYVHWPFPDQLAQHPVLAALAGVPRPQPAAPASARRAVEIVH
ncbi:MAG: hypothetical protein AAGG09_09395 [Pseudomonadota bacterium]